MKKNYFPHISRLFSAKKFGVLLNVFLWVFLITCFIINLQTSLLYAGVTNSAIAATLYPHDEKLNRLLSDRFGKSGNRSVSEELRRSREFLIKLGKMEPEPPPVLGSHIQTVDYWESIIVKLPDYRDAYLAAAKSALANNDTDAALLFASKAIKLDPNDHTAQMLLDVLETSKK